MTKLYCFSKTNLQEIKKDITNRDLSLNQLELSWIKYFVNNTPNGKLILENSYTQDFSKREYIDFLHITSSLNEVVKSRKVYMSSGGLGFALYCSILHKDGTPHNIADVYYNFQLKLKDKQVDAIVVRVYPKKKFFTSIHRSGVNYTMFGEYNLASWKHIKKNYDDYEIIEKRINKKIRENIEKIHTLSYVKSSSNKEFLRQVQELLKNIPQLRFILYEVMTEYILYMQDNKVTRFFRDEKKELYNLFHKKIIFTLSPKLSKKFDLCNLNVDLLKLYNQLGKHPAFKSINLKDFLFFFRYRISFHLRKSLKIPIESKLDNSQRKRIHSNLFGHIVYRWNKDIKCGIEKKRASLLLQEWSKKDQLISIYSIIPKGEVGITPVILNSNVKYEIYAAKFRDCNSPIEIQEKLNVKITPKLICNTKKNVR